MWKCYDSYALLCIVMQCYAMLCHVMQCCAIGVAGIPQRAGTLKPLAKRSCNSSASGHAQICLPTSFFCYLDGMAIQLELDVLQDI